MKYIIVVDPIDRTDTPFIFPNFIGHDDMAHAVNADRSMIVGAGFVELVDGRCQCFGMSTSLEVRSRPEIDTQIINKLLTKKSA